MIKFLRFLLTPLLIAFILVAAGILKLSRNGESFNVLDFSQFIANADVPGGGGGGGGGGEGGGGGGTGTGGGDCGNSTGECCDTG